MSKPLITFVVPTRNRLEWIGECLSSLLSQSEKDIEVICVDDASDDGTHTFIDWMASHDERLTITGISPGTYDVKLTDKIGRVCIVKDVEVKDAAVFAIEEKQLTDCRQ